MEHANGEEMAVRSELTADESADSLANSDNRQSLLNTRRATSAHNYIASELGQD